MRTMLGSILIYFTRYDLKDLTGSKNNRKKNENNKRSGYKINFAGKHSQNNSHVILIQTQA